jgi:hypothetical protein
MTMTDHPGLPAELMDLQPIPSDQLDLLAELSRAFPGSTAELLAAAANAEPTGEQHLLLESGEADAILPAELVLASRAEAAVRFAVTDRSLAEWAMRKLVEIESIRRERKALAKQWRDEVDRWEREELRPLDAKASFFEGHLNDYMLRERAESGDTVKSIKLPSGTLKSTGSTTPKAAIEDQEALLGWARELPAQILEGDGTPIKTTEEVQISRLAKLVQVHIVEEPIEGEADDDGEPLVAVQQYVTLAFDPETGEPWGDDFDPAEHAIPGARVEIPGIKPRVEPNL